MNEQSDFKALKKRIKDLEKENAHLKLFKLSLENMPDILFSIINREYCYEAVNEAYACVFNRKTDQIIGKHAIEIFGDKRFHAFAKPNYDKSLNGEHVDFSDWIHFPNSIKKFLNIHYYPLRIGADIIAVAILAQDITTLKQTEELLIESQAHCEKTQQLAHIGHWNWNPMEDKISCSAEFYRILGLSPDNFSATYKDYERCLHPDDLGILRDSAKNILETPKTTSKNYRIVHPNGNIRIVHDISEPCVDLSGNPTNIFGTIQDITEQIQAQQQYHTIIQTAIDGFCLSDPQGRLLEVNASFCKMLGYGCEELLLLNLSDIHASQRPQETGRMLRKVRLKGQCQFTTKCQRKDGAFIDVEMNIKYSDIKNGIFISFIRDITKKIQIRNMLKNSERRYRKLFDDAPMMYVRLKYQKNIQVISDCNKHFIKRLGYKKTDVIGKPISFFHTKSSQEEFSLEDNHSLTDRNSFTISERELVSHDGEIVNALVQKVSEYDINGNAVGTCVTFIDISCQKRAEQKLKESYELLLMIVDGISDPLLMVNKKMDIIIMNTAAEAYFKNSNENCLGKKCYQVFKKKHRPCKGCKVPLAMSNAHKEIFERKGIMDPGILEKVSIYPVRKEGKMWAAIIRLSDITKTKQIENELIQADKMISLGVLVSGVAHEINNPNNFIMLNTPILRKAWESITPVVEAYYKKNGDFCIANIPYNIIREEIPLLFSGISEGAKRIQEFVQELKFFVRNDNIDINQSLNINHVIKKAILLTENLIKEKTDHFKVNYNSNPPVIKGDPQKIEQVIINLIENACQALDNKNKKIMISSFLEKTTGYVVVKIEDEGKGIHPKILNRIMEPFFTTKRSKGGTGLGLAVSSHIIELHNGKIVVDSTIDKGSTFRILLPIQCGKDPVQ